MSLRAWPLQQWVLSVPKRLRYHLERDSAVLNAALHIFLTAIARVLRQHGPGLSAASRLGAVVFIHRFGALRGTHLHFHCVVVDGVFEADATGGAFFTRPAHWMCPLSGRLRPPCAGDCCARSRGAACCRRTTRR